jgi:hypothetical protein
LISNLNLLKGQRSITLVHKKYTKEPLMSKKRRIKLQKLREIRNGQTIAHYYRNILTGKNQIVKLSLRTVKKISYSNEKMGLLVNEKFPVFCSHLW